MKPKDTFLTPAELVARWKEVTSVERLQRWRIFNKETGMAQGPVPTKMGSGKTSPVLYEIEGDKGIIAFEKGKYTHYDQDHNLFKNGIEVK